MDRRLRFAALPEAFRDMTLSTFRVGVYQGDIGRETARNACACIKYYLDNLDSMQRRGMGLYLCSHTKGSGKTRMAASIANYLMQTKGLQVKFATSAAILQEIRQCWDEKGRSESTLLDALSTVQVLIIDDFGMERVRDWVNERFYQIINGRYIGCKVTIYTSNLSLAELEYDGRITNRIKERSYQVAFPEESVRESISRGNQEEMLAGIAGLG